MALDFHLVLLLALIIVTSSSIITVTHTEAFAGKSLPTDTKGRKTLAQEQPYIPSIVDISDLNRTTFPQSFIFGTASAAYQYEGAAAEGGKGPSIWDTFTHKYPEKIADRSTGDVADDQYHRYKEDIGIMKYMNLDAYRFSISWSRVLPKGKLSGGVNQEGINYYNNLINELIANGIQPFVTLFHWDLPQALEDEYQGLLSPLIVNDFRDYADLCFKEFGDRVKHWITFNEPSSVSQQAYSDGTFAPGRCSAWLRRNCTGGNSGTEPYITSHYQLLSHAAAANLYKTKYKESQKGLIGITLNTYWFMPLTDDKSSQDAAQRALDFMFGWYMDPLTKGEYPKSMQTLVGNRLPKFTSEEAQQLKGSMDFLGLNYYSSIYAANALPVPLPGPTLETDPRIILSVQRDGKLLGPTAASSWLIIYPKGLEEILLYIKNRYNNTLVYITENGCDEYNNPKLSLNEALVDTNRFAYLYDHLYYLLRAIKDGVNVKGYFHWSLLDNMEWNSGYTVRFGLVFVDYKNGLKRYPKLSGQWFKKFLNKT